MDIQKLAQQVIFSRCTFGPGERRVGILRHIEKELAEIRAAQTQQEVVDEWVDVVILALDGLTRAVRVLERQREDDYRRRYDIENTEPLNVLSPEDIATLAVHFYTEKIHKNLERDWPDWRDFSEGDAIEHSRLGD